MPEILSKFCYPHEWNMKREPARPLELRVLNFDKSYDYSTIWNDAVQINQDVVLLIGPPLYSTALFLQNSCEFFDDCNRKIQIQISEMDRACITVARTHGVTTHIKIVNSFGSWILSVQQPDSCFSNKKVIVTISKNHPIDWLVQWIQYHYRVHNIEGLLLYNNQSSIYTSAELENSLQNHGMTVKVVDYDVPFGTMGGGLWEWQGRSGTFLPWDSDFAQYVMLEHAKWRYLHCAKLAINADTDELLTLDNSSLDQFADYCMHSSNSVWLYKGIWVEPVDSRTGTIAVTLPFDQRHFKNYWHTAYSNQRGIGIKWMLNPQKNLNYQWLLHRTAGPHMYTNEISFGHYMAMNTSWSWQRDAFNGDKNNLIELPNLKKNLNKAFSIGA